MAQENFLRSNILAMMIGQDMQISFKALIIGILAHALYKSTLFLVVGIVDYETGTRDLRRLGRLRRSMPFTFATGGLAALSMAGLPPLFGFQAKETLLATAVHPSLPTVVPWIFTLASVLTGALMLVISGRLIWDTFLGQPRDPDIHGHFIGNRPGGADGFRRSSGFCGVRCGPAALFGAALPLYRVDWVFPNWRKPDNMEIDMISDFNLTIKAVFSN